MAKTNWFKKKRRGDKDNQDQQLGGRGGAHSRPKDREQCVGSRAMRGEGGNVLERGGSSTGPL